MTKYRIGIGSIAAVNQAIPSLTYNRVVRPIFPLDPEVEDTDLSPQVFAV